MRVTRSIPIALVAAILACSSGDRPARTVAPVAASGSAAPAPAPAPAPRLVLDAITQLDKRVHSGVLPNGLTYYVLEHHQPEHRAYLWLAVNAGSVQEDDDQRGLAHFVEHMAFNGTAGYAEHEIIHYLEKIGMRFGPDVNAFTSFDETVYQLQVPTDDAKFLDKGLDILHEWAGKIAFDPKEVGKERGVVLEEWRLGRGAEARVFDREAAVLFAGTRYADRLTIGLPPIIRGATRDVLQRFYRDWYRPDLMAVIAVGDFSAATIEAAIARRFGDLVAPAAPRPRPRGAVPPTGRTRISIVTDPEITDQSVTIYNQLPHRRELTVGDYRRAVADGLYNSMLNERLEELLDRPDAPMTFAGSSTSDLTRDIDAFGRFATAKRGRLADTVRVLLTEVLRVEQHGFTETELARAKRRVLRDIQQSAREHDKRDGYEFADELTRLYFQQEQMPGREIEAEMTARMLPTFTLAELDQLARQWGGDENRVVLISGPSKLKVSEAEVKAWLATAAAQKLEPWHDAVADRKLMTTLPAPGKITAEKKLPAIGVTEWTLSNGARVVVKPTDFAIDEVQLDGFSPGGTSLATDAQFESAQMASEIVGRSGVGDLRDPDLRKVLSGLVVDVDTYIGELSERVRGQGSAEDLETMLQLVHLKMTAPRKDPDAFAVWKAETEQWVRGWGVDPERGFWDDLTRFMTRDHPRRRPPSMKRLAQVDPDQALAFYRERFGDASDFTFVLVGNVDLAKLRPLVERYLASLPARGRKETWKDIGVKYIPGVAARTVRRGREPKALVRMFFHGDEPWSRDAEIDLDNLVDVLDMRLFELLREDMSGVYGVDVGGGIERRPRQRRSVAISFGCAPGAVKRLRAAVLAEIHKLGQAGVDEVVLTKLRQQLIRGHEVELKDNGYWLGGLSDAYELGDDPARLLDIKAELDRLTNAHVRAAARRFLSTHQYVTGVLLPRARRAK